MPTQPKSVLGAKTVSPAVQFLTLAEASLPKGTGDRDWHSFMALMLGQAIGYKMIFDKDDGPALERLSARCQYGVFSPVSETWYSQACRVGGTYSRMYEKAVGLTPWVAPIAILDQRGEQAKANSRVAPGMGVILPKTEKDDPAAAKTRTGDQIWRCTSITNDHIVLCRYSPNPERGHGYSGGAPFKRWKLSRAEWTALHGSKPREAAPATADHAPSDAAQEAVRG